MKMEMEEAMARHPLLNIDGFADAFPYQP